MAKFAIRRRLRSGWPCSCSARYRRYGTNTSAAVLARIKAALDSLTKTLLIPVPLLLALAAGLMSGKPEVSASGVALRLDLAQLLVMLTVGLALIHSTRMVFTIGRFWDGATDKTAIAAMLEADTATMNPFARMPDGSGVLRVFDLFLVLAPSMVIGAAMGFTYPLVDSP